jgi:hypothetical protein
VRRNGIPDLLDREIRYFEFIPIGVEQWFSRRLVHRSHRGQRGRRRGN